MTDEAGLWNVANVLTMVRIVLVPVFVGFLLAGGTVWRLAALATFCVASLTDLIDGRLARMIRPLQDGENGFANRIPGPNQVPCRLPRMSSLATASALPRYRTAEWRRPCPLSAQPA